MLKARVPFLAENTDAFLEGLYPLNLGVSEGQN
jgi:hypothetical protein